MDSNHGYTGTPGRVAGHFSADGETLGDMAVRGRDKGVWGEAPSEVLVAALPLESRAAGSPPKAVGV
jgi:hypothetical protein